MEQMTIFDFLEEPQKAAVDEEWICDNCIYDHKGGCAYNTQDDYCVLGNKKKTDVDVIRDIEAHVCYRVFDYTWRCCNEWLELPDRERIEKAKKYNHGSGGGVDNYIWNVKNSGIDIEFDEPIGKTKAVHIGWPMFIKRYPVKEVDVRGIMDDGYCPECEYPLNDLERQCSECGTYLDWRLWKKLNKE